ncbi:protein-serine O-palmitoleoyltransferase porcupine [Macrosteles quadrilineatus]|uniref:protein-serine O-palmitoleoyltransferase porcupine n=1 Tax=Macrosteles quadrilineatus TaxID=74068 RepID=UPI0023E2837E|nr:protein-serine O-palmitoleoyltransferase porcupine [Macrosteles quadrilineatus]
MMYEDEDYEEFEPMYTQEVDEEEGSGLWLVFEHCLTPTLRGLVSPLLHLIVSCLVFRLSTQLVAVPMVLRHLVSSLLGLYALAFFFKGLVVDLLVLVVAAYVVLSILHSLELSHGPIVSILSFTYLIGNEFFLEPESWQKIRGPEMLVVMKVVSIAFDLDSGSLRSFPSVWEYCGYVLCVGTSVFGVWCSFNDYLNIYVSPVWNKEWALMTCRSLLLALVSFSTSVCLVDWLIPPESPLWWGLYRDALQFRTSHYFVSYVSETVAVLSGLGAGPGGEWTLSVSEPRHIELPHSLVQVVVSWNKYMHKWLKLYVFRTTSQYGGLVAVMATYTVSSLLHGLHYPLAAILMSLGIYTFVEHSIRYRLSVMLDACVAARPCPNVCTRHKHTARLLPVTVVNWLWSMLAVFHLAYLGCIVDTSDSSPAPFPQAFQKWNDVHYISHIVALVTYFLYFCVK